MVLVEDSVEINAPIDDVFREATDPRRTPEWNTNIVSVAEIPALPLAEGATWKQVAMVAGKRLNLVCRVARWQPPYEGALQVSGDQQAQLVTRCERTTGATRVIQRMEFVPPGGLAGSLGAKLMLPILRTELQKSLMRMRDTLEHEFREGSPGPQP